MAEITEFNFRDKLIKKKKKLGLLSVCLSDCSLWENLAAMS